MARPVHAPLAPASDSCGFGSQGRPRSQASSQGAEAARRHSGRRHAHRDYAARWRRDGRARFSAGAAARRRRGEAHRTVAGRTVVQGMHPLAPEPNPHAMRCSQQTDVLIHSCSHPTMCMHVSCLHIRIACGRMSHTLRRGCLFKLCVCCACTRLGQVVRSRNGFLGGDVPQVSLDQTVSPWDSLRARLPWATLRPCCARFALPGHVCACLCVVRAPLLRRPCAVPGWDTVPDGMPSARPA